MVVQQTSIQTYCNLALGQRQYEVYKLLKTQIFGLNNRMIAERLNKPINSITPRVNELVSMGIVEEHYKDVDEVTKRNTIFWSVK
jgi:predicted transcriptional regulator